MAAGAWRQNQRRWQIAPAFEGAEELARKLGTSPLVAQILHNRGADSVEAAQAFLHPRMTDLLDPLELPQIEPAAARIAAAIAAGEPITIYGDYDVDGMTALAVLHACLKMLGGKVNYYVPHRLEEGYGVNAASIQKIIESGTKLIVTVDCGISAKAALELATKAGVDVIVTDHHQPPEQLPQAVAIVHPSLPGGSYNNPNLSGSGVAFKLAWQVARQVAGKDRLDEPMRNFMVEAMTLAALGIIADVVPLVGENRIFATFGLRALPTTKHVGLRAMLESADLVGERLDAYHVGFVLAPRLNACGRMGHAKLAVELLTEAPAQRCREIAQYLAQQNESRQKVEREITQQAIQRVEQEGLDQEDNRVIVLADEGWHAGVIGIVASRLVERYHRPCVLIALSDGRGQGSGRSVDGYNLHDALQACSAHLVGFGGHEMAGGVKILRENVPAFREAMAAHARQHLAPGQLRRILHADAEISLGSLDHNLAAHLGKLSPHGQGNPAPVVVVRGCKLVTPPKRMGRNGKTVGFMVGQNGASVRCVGFGMGDLADDLAGVNLLDIAAEPTINSFNGRTSVELHLKDVQLPE